MPMHAHRSHACPSCTINKTAVRQLGAFKKTGVALRKAITSLRGVLPKAKAPSQAAPSKAKAPSQAALPKAKAPSQAALPKAKAPSQAAKPRSKTAAASALRQPQVLAPGQAPPQHQTQAHMQGMAQPAQGFAHMTTAGSTALKRPLPASGGSSSGIVDLTDSPPYKRQHGRPAAHEGEDVYEDVFIEEGFLY
jgi:hypothetical protein